MATANAPALTSALTFLFVFTMPSALEMCAGLVRPEIEPESDARLDGALVRRGTCVDKTGGDNFLLNIKENNNFSCNSVIESSHFGNFPHPNRNFSFFRVTVTFGGTFLLSHIIP